ncbi:succinylglutamate desuccinylase/aspartoacylase family protein [Ekhidna sp. MALMAid0563]|uniref:succinylglutamate desuccinylase/aspartoacylase family protein n=1 Tax=Ekhidna sp. MALMAid0563 TaxID=3143937 RepID=UPI0032DFF57A
MDFNLAPEKLHRQNIPTARLPSGTVIEIPIFSYEAKKEGPTLLLMAGMHGDEINGVEIMRRIITQKLYQVQSGRVILVPVFNVFGFINFSREVPDGKDVNRSFPGNKNGSLASQFAYFMTSEVLPHINFGIDFHTGGKQINNFPQVRGMLDEPKNNELAHAFASPFIINSPYRDKSLRKEAGKLGKSILIYEAGESLKLRKPAIDEGLAGMKRVMKHLNMIENAPSPSREPIVISKSTWTRASRAGLHYAQARNGSLVKKGEVMGVISDPYGEYEKKIKATHDCHILSINNNPVVNRGDALFHTGVEAS